MKKETEKKAYAHRVILKDIRKAVKNRFDYRYEAQMDDLIRRCDREIRDCIKKNKKFVFSQRSLQNGLLNGIRIHHALKPKIVAFICGELAKKGRGTYLPPDRIANEDFMHRQRNVGACFVPKGRNYRDRLVDEISYRVTYSLYFERAIKDNPELKRLIQEACQVALMKVQKDVDDLEPTVIEDLDSHDFEEMDVSEAVRIVQAKMSPYLNETDDDDKEMERNRKIRKDLKSLFKSYARVYNLRGIGESYRFIPQAQPGNYVRREELMSTHLNKDRMFEDGITEFKDSFLFKRDYIHHRDYLYDPDNLDIDLDLPPGFIPDRTPNLYAVLLSHMTEDLLTPHRATPSGGHGSYVPNELSSGITSEMSRAFAEQEEFGIGKRETTSEVRPREGSRLASFMSGEVFEVRKVPAFLENDKVAGRVQVYEVDDLCSPRRRFLFRKYSNRFYDFAQEELVASLMGAVTHDEVSRELASELYGMDVGPETRDEEATDACIPEKKDDMKAISLEEDRKMMYEEFEQAFTEEDVEPTDEDLKKILAEEKKESEPSMAEVEEFFEHRRKATKRLASKRVTSGDTMDVFDAGFYERRSA